MVKPYLWGETSPQVRLLKVNFSRHQGASILGRQYFTKRSLSGGFLHTPTEAAQSTSRQRLPEPPLIAPGVGYPKVSQYASSAEFKRLALTTVGSPL
ncbi:hypothetical protein U2718_033170 [Chlorogloeopsis sp. ULAP02]